jgi:hypothetical protein
LIGELIDQVVELFTGDHVFIVKVDPAGRINRDKLGKLEGLDSRHANGFINRFSEEL